jgi:hypothetical protein
MNGTAAMKLGDMSLAAQAYNHPVGDKVIIIIAVVTMIAMKKLLQHTYTNIQVLAQSAEKKTREFFGKMIESSCINEDNYDEVTGKLDRDTEWIMPEDMPANMTKDQFMKMKCDLSMPGLVQICPVLEDSPEPIIYHICKATNYCAIKRQATEVTYPEETELAKFKEWYNSKILPEIQGFLADFNYSYTEWYNHLDAGKQSEVDGINKIDLALDNTFEMFVKSEKQLYEKTMVDGIPGVKAPKNRCICAASPEHKYVMGPITWKLAEYMDVHLKGYCGNKNWTDLEHYYNTMEDMGFVQTVQLDGSGFDRTQHYEIKQIVDHSIYNFLIKTHKITHVTNDQFSFYATPEFRTIKMVEVVDKSKRNLGKIVQRGKVYSGTSDTTLMNTVRMALYNRYVAETKLGLQKHEYGLLCKGDDATLFMVPKTQQQIETAYFSVFSQKKTGVHGLGQIAKYLNIGGIEDVDFCSTSTYYDHVQGYKIVRQLKRFLSLTPWSRKAVNMTTDQIKVYKQALYLSNLHWMRGLPLYSQFNELLKTDIRGIKFKTKDGKKKQTFIDDEIVDSPALLKILDNMYLCEDFYYSQVNRVSDKCKCPDVNMCFCDQTDFIHYLYTKFPELDAWHINAKLVEDEMKTTYLGEESPTQVINTIKVDLWGGL